MEPLIQTILTVVGGILISAITSIITVRLALKQFYSQKWWERKADAYSTIIEALYHVKNDLGANFDHEVGAIQLSEERSKILAEEAKKGYGEIYKAEGIGAYVISKEAAQSLTQLRRQFSSEDPSITWIERINNDYITVTKCLEDIRYHAKRDLHIK